MLCAEGSGQLATVDKNQDTAVGMFTLSNVDELQRRTFDRAITRQHHVVISTVKQTDITLAKTKKQSSKSNDLKCTRQYKDV